MISGRSVGFLLVSNLWQFQPSVIDHYLHIELEKGRVAGPFSISPIPNLHVSRFGIIQNISLENGSLFQSYVAQ